MSSGEAYLDSLLDSILNGGKSEEEENTVPEETEEVLTENKAADAGKAMSPDEIEEMLVSMGTLGGGEDGAQEQDSEEDMEAMLALMDEHNNEAAGSEDSEGSSADADDFSFDDLSLDNLEMEESGSDDFALDDLSLDDLALAEPGMDDGGSDGMDDLSLDDLALAETGMDDGGSNGMDDLSLDGLALEETGTDDGGSDGMDDFSLDDLSLDDLSLDEPEGGASDTADDLSLDDMDMGESNLDDLSLDDLSLDDLSSDEPENGDDDADGFMSEEDIDRLLNGDLSDEMGNDFALEETEGEGDDDLSALLAGMEHDEDLSEINDLLEESDQGVPSDDDMLAMLEGAGEDGSFDLFESDEAAREAESIRELSPEEIAERESGNQGKKKKKKRKKLFGKKKKDGDEEIPSGDEGVEDELEALLGEVSAEQETETPQKEKKPGFLARVMDFLLESDEEDEDPLAAEVLAGNDGETGTITDENRELLQELSDEDKKGKKKKKKKDKKGKKGKNGKEEEEDEKKEKKPKKVKKKKEKKKKAEETDLFAPPEKKLSKKKVITVFLFCGTIAASIIVFATILPDSMQKKEAQTAYDQGNYADVYGLLYGKELSEQDKVLFQGSNLILQMDRKLSSYNNYVNLGMSREALNALITGVERYHQILPEAENYNVATEVYDIYAQILGILSANYGLSETDVLNILASEDDLIYSQKLEAVINGESVGEEEEAEVGIQDVLPEEEEIMERIGGADGETEIELEPEDVSTEELPDDQAADENADEGAE